jgi:hypothetical protein
MMFLLKPMLRRGLPISRAVMLVIRSLVETFHLYNTINVAPIEVKLSGIFQNEMNSNERTPEKRNKNNDNDLQHPSVAEAKIAIVANDDVV